MIATVPDHLRATTLKVCRVSPPLQAMNDIMEYSRIYGNIMILWWHGQSQLKLDMSMPDHKKTPKPFVNGSVVWSSYVPQAPFLQQE